MKIKILLEDTRNGHVKVIFDPALASLVRGKLFGKHEFTPAESYAFVMANAVKEASQRLDKYDENKPLSGPSDFSI